MPSVVGIRGRDVAGKGKGDVIKSGWCAEPSLGSLINLQC